MHVFEIVERERRPQLGDGAEGRIAEQGRRPQEIVARHDVGGEPFDLVGL